ncbi:uncharacterized protein [Lepeophtheirus salmonis]|uniref:uncharacterized protein isoform X1 n=2 Tax=Lepeophtheirus salmonis TaxID=72036 RepID=UPI001AE4E474|nr:uncharacterized protein LOC121123401 isoform X1 [Lepeophtheirus salmonis]
MKKHHGSIIPLYLFLVLLPLSESNNTTISNTTEIMEERKGLYTTSIKPPSSDNNEGGYFAEGMDDYDNNIGNNVMDLTAYSRQGYDNEEYVDIGDNINLPERIPFLPGVPRVISYYGDYEDENEGDFREYEDPDYFRNSPPNPLKPISNLNPPQRPGFPYREVYDQQRERYPEEQDGNYIRDQGEEDRYPPEYDDYGGGSQRPKKNSYEEETEEDKRFRSPAPSENQVGFFDYFDNEDAYVTTPRYNVGPSHRAVNHHDSQADHLGYERNYNKNVNEGFQYPIYKKIPDENPNNPYAYTSYNHRLYQKNTEHNAEY